MNSSAHNYVTTNEILADVLKIVGDESFKFNSKGFYTSQIQQAINELAFETYFDERSESFDLPSNMRLQMPKGAFNIKNIYLFHGDECDITKSVNVYYKKDFVNSKSGATYVSKNKGDNGDDPFYVDNLRTEMPSNVFFYSVQNGEIMFSSNCAQYPKVFIQYSGVGTDIGDVPYVPLFLRQAVKDWVAVKGLEVKIAMVDQAEFNRWMTVLNVQKNNLGEESQFRGSWYTAQVRVRKMDMKARRDYKLYMQKMYY